MNHFSLIIDKLLKSYEVHGIRELRRILSSEGIKKNTFDTWKKRGEISAEGIIELSRISKIRVEDLTGGTSFATEGRSKITSSGGKEMRIQSLLVSAEKVLRSSSPFAEALSQNIDAFLVGLDLWEKKEVGHHLKKGEGESP